MSRSRVALITGITGQDGYYLTQYLGTLGYKVYGLIRRQSERRMDSRKEKLFRTQGVEMIEGDLTDITSITRALEIAEPDEVYNLGAQSFVGVSWKIPIQTSEVTGLGALNVFEAVRQFDDSIRIYQASSSEMFGKVREPLQSEKTPFYPRSPYAVAKVFAHWSAVNYRESYGMHISSGILFNHESPLRGIEFLTRKVTHGAAKVKLGMDKYLYLGNLEAKRDWGHARDYMKAAHKMLQMDEPDDYVIATGRTESVEFFVKTVFDQLGIDWKDYVKQDERFMRPAEVPVLLGDASKAKEKLGWEPEVSLEELISEMTQADYAKLQREGR